MGEILLVTQYPELRRHADQAGQRISHLIGELGSLDALADVGKTEAALRQQLTREQQYVQSLTTPSPEESGV